MKKKVFSMILVLVLIFLSTSSNAFADSSFGKSDKVKIKSTIRVKLNDAENAGNDVVILNDKGTTVFTYKNPVETKDVSRANTILVNLMKTAETEAAYVNCDTDPGTFYGNDTGTDSNGYAYTWAYFQINCQPIPLTSWSASTWGGMSGYWTGSNFQKMKLNEAVTVTTMGLGAIISWPPGLNTINSSTQRSWSSEVTYSNPTGATHESFPMSGTMAVNAITHIIYSDSADIYLNGNSHIYRPSTYIDFYGM